MSQAPQRNVWQVGLALAVALLPAVANPWLYPVDVQSPPAWAALLTVAAVACMGFLAHGALLGAVAALAVGMHPLLHHNGGAGSWERLGEAYIFLAAVLTMLAWRQLTAERLRWWLALGLLVALSLLMGGIWRVDRLLGLRAGLGLFLSLGILAPTASPLARLRHPWLRRGLLVCMGLVPSAAALALARDFALFQTGPLQLADLTALAQTWATALHDAFLVPWWVSAPLVAWAWWRTVRRGLKRRARGEVPATWGISVHSLLVGLGTLIAGGSSGIFSAVIVWSVFLLVFLVFDLLQGVGERLVLQPPEDKQI